MDSTPEELRSRLRQSRDDIAAGRAATATLERVATWQDVVAAVQARSATLDAVAVLSPGDVAPVDLLAQEDWPPAAPVLAPDGSWVLSIDTDGEPVLVWPAVNYGS